MSIIVFSLCSILYFFLHSFLADDGIKHRLNRLFPGEEKYHRILYNLISSAGLGFLFWGIFSPDFTPFLKVPFWFRILGTAGLFCGVVLLCFSFRNYDPAEFLGIDRLKGKVNLEEPRIQLSLSGLNAFVRHPIYLSVLVLSLSFVVVYPSRHAVALFLIICTYLPVGIWLEERKLIRKFGDAYRTYRKAVPAVIPFLKRLFENRY
jgi:protein-S-isoprenylcysteine O-methyltransferase Ste14